VLKFKHLKFTPRVKLQTFLLSFFLSGIFESEKENGHFVRGVSSKPAMKNPTEDPVCARQGLISAPQYGSAAIPCSPSRSQPEAMDLAKSEGRKGELGTCPSSPLR